MTLNSVRSNGTSTFSQIPHSPLNTGFGAYCSIHYLSNVGAGTHTITASLSSSNHVTMFATEIIGAAASDVVRADNTGSGTSVNITGANVAVSAGDFLFGVILCGGTVVSVGSPYSSDSTEHQVIWAANVSAGTYGLSYVQDSSQPWAGLLAAFKAAPIGGTVHGLSGIAAGISATSAALNARRALGGSVLGQGATSAFLSRSLHLTGATSGTSSTRAMATAIRRMSGLSVGHSAASATVTMRRSLSGTTSGLSEASAKLSISRALQGIAAGTSAVIGTLAGTVQLIALSGITAGKAVCSGALSVARRLSGTAVGQSTTTGKLSALRGFSAITRGTSASIGRLSAIRGMLGAAIGTASLQAHLSITRALQAISAGIGTLIGQLSSVIPFIPVEPDFTIPAESRTLHVIGESRTFQAGQEDRTFHV